jgi:uncharacterized protein YkwD
LRRIAALIAVSVAAGAALPAAPAAASPPPELVMFKQINKIRRAHGLARLRPAFSLFVSAKVYARRMMRSNYFGHQARIPVASRWRMAGETLEWHSGWRLRPRSAVRRWMWSPPHRAVLLSSRFTRLGVGRARGNYGRGRATMWVAHVARR